MIRFLIKLVPGKKLRSHLRDKFLSQEDNKVIISTNSRCLIVCPHADDEIIGAGGLLLKYPQNFDCICIGSSGIQYKEITPKQRSDIRVNEFNKVMKTLGISSYWIFETYGIPPLIDQIKSKMMDYLSVLKTQNYDYIFLPNPKDNHPEHQFITKKLFKQILKKLGFKKNLKIVFYEVWTPLDKVSYYEDISDVAKRKFEILSMYESQHVWIKYDDKIEGLNKYRGMLANNVDYAEAYMVLPVRKYLNN